MSTSSVPALVASQILACCTDAEGYVDYEAYDILMSQEAAAFEPKKEKTMSRITELQTRIANLKANPCRRSPMLIESSEAELKLEERHAFGMAIAHAAYAMVRTASPEQLNIWYEECMASAVSEL